MRPWTYWEIFRLPAVRNQAGHGHGGEAAGRRVAAGRAAYYGPCRHRNAARIAWNHVRRRPVGMRRGHRVPEATRQVKGPRLEARRLFPRRTKCASIET